MDTAKTTKDDIAKLKESQKKAIRELQQSGPDNRREIQSVQTAVTATGKEAVGRMIEQLGSSTSQLLGQLQKGQQVLSSSMKEVIGFRHVLSPCGLQR